MYPFDKLTQENIEFMKRYIEAYANVKNDDLRPVLQAWNKNKRTLFKALGKELQVKIPIEVPRNTVMYNNQLSKIYYSYPILSQYDIEDFIHNDYIKNVINNEFVNDAFEFLILETAEDLHTIQTFSRLLSHSNVEEGKTIRDYNFPLYGLNIRKGTKIAKAVQKVLKVAKYPNMHLFEKWRNEISDLNVNRSMKANLVLSINPIDYMTMSDNNCNWSSCMSWIKDGMYSNGTIEMMNSNVAMVAYLESDSPYEVCDMVAPNKSWRSLVFVHKDILIVGKNYPYYHESLCKRVLKEVAALLKKNLGWDYSFKEQMYRDLHRFESNELVRFDLNRHRMQYKTSFNNNGGYKKTPRHKILCYTRMMYNDMICDHDSVYWCYRNKVDKTLFLSLSGRSTCMCCGEYIFNEYESPRCDEGNVKICANCHADKTCIHCGKTYQNTKTCSLTRATLRFGKVLVCTNELSEIRYYPGLGVAALDDTDYPVTDEKTGETLCWISRAGLVELGFTRFAGWRGVTKQGIEEKAKGLGLSYEEVIKLTRFKTKMTKQELREVGIVE